MPTTNRLMLSVSAFALAVSLTGGAALAAEQPTAIDEVIVTATGRGEAIKDTPLTVAVVSGESLAAQNVTSADNLAKVDPSVNIRNFGAGESSFVIRGIVSQAIGSNPTTGLYLDDTPILGGQANEGGGDGLPAIRLIDLQRVEILKGPQGTLFGAGSMGGTIRAITNQPDLSGFSGSVTGTVATVDKGNELTTGNVVLNVPWNDTLAVRYAGWLEEGGGYINQELPGGTIKDVNDIHVRGSRLSLLWQPNDIFKLVARGTYQTFEGDGTFAHTVGAPDYVSRQESQVPFRDRHRILDLTGSLKALSGTFTGNVSRTSYYRFRPIDTTNSNREFGFDFPATFGQEIDYHSTSVELRYASNFDGPFQVVAGLYYLDDYSWREGTVAPADPSSGQLPCFLFRQCAAIGLTNVVEYSNRRRQDTEQKAAYVQADYKILDNLRATVGIRRYTAEITNVKVVLQTVPGFLRGIVPPPKTTLIPAEKESDTTYNFALSWEATSDITVFARAASGYRIGGLNDAEDGALNYGVIVSPGFKSDSLWNYELGMKSSFLDGRMFVDASVFHIDWSNQQLPAVLRSFFYTVNGGKSVVDGAEITVRTRPAEGLNVDFGVTYVNAKLDDDLPQEVIDAGTVGLKGDRLPNTPKWTLSANAEYSRPLSDQWNGFVGATMSYRGETRNSFSSDVRARKLASYTLVDARLGVRNDDYEIGVFATNLFNEQGIVGRNDLTTTFGVPVEYVTPPRTIGVKASRHF